MKKIIVVSLILFVSFFVSACTEKGSDLTQEEKQQEPIEETKIIEDNIIVEVGDVFNINYAANPTTGYKWELDVTDPKVRLLKQEYIAPNDSMLGAGGEEDFEMEALEAGEANLEFKYFRTWETREIKRMKVTVTIQE